MKEENLQLTGTCTLIVRDKSGKILSVEKKKNLIVDVGKAYVAKLIGALTESGPRYIQIGTGTTPPSPSDTELESFYKEKGATRSFSAPSSVVFTATFYFEEDMTITESGLFLASQTREGRIVGKTMLARQVFAGKLIEAGRYLEVIWTIGVR